MPRFSLHHGPLALLALVCALVCAAPAAASGPFAADSVWDAPLAGNAPLAANSAGLVAELRRQTFLPGGTWINSHSYSVPVYTVPGNQPTVRVIADTPYPPLQDAWAQVPLPPDARPAPGSDGHLVVHQPATDTLWEFWAMRQDPDGWHAWWGAKMEHVSQNPGYMPSPWGGTGTSLALMGGLIRADEMAAGRIDHALALAIPQAKQGEVVWPAQRGDGVAAGTDAIPEGTRFRIDPHFDLDSVWMPPAARVLAEAVQRYGMIVRDQAGAVVLYAEDPYPLGADPWPGLFNEWPNNLVNSLPWAHMQVVVPDRSAFAVPVPPDVTPTPTPVPPVATPTPPDATPTPAPPVMTPTPVPPVLTPTPTPKPKATPTPKPKATPTPKPKVTPAPPKPSAKARAASTRANAACAKARRKGASAKAKRACRDAKATAAKLMSRR